MEPSKLNKKVQVKVVPNMTQCSCLCEVLEMNTQ